MHQRVSMTTAAGLLGVPPGYPAWRVADMARRARALPTWLSAAEADGIDLTPAAKDLLDRERRRVAALHRTAEDMAAAHRVTVLKGLKIARHYPKGLLRQSGDVDLVAHDEEALWGCVQDLMERFAAVPQGVSVMRREGERTHYGVALKWPAEEPYADKPMGADVTTCAFAGNFAGVPIRVEPPPDELLCGIFAVAEERFQRKYRLKDRLDLLVLAEAAEDEHGGALVELVVAEAEKQCLAPELARLIDQTDEWVSVSPLWMDIRAALDVSGEKARRKERENYTLNFGLPLTGHRTERAEIDGDLLTTPIGACLLVASPVLDQETIDTAIRRLNERDLPRREGPDEVTAAYAA